MLQFLWLNRDLWDIKTSSKCIVRHDTNENIVEVYVDEFDMDLAENESDKATEEIKVLQKIALNQSGFT